MLTLKLSARVTADCVTPLSDLHIAHTWTPDDSGRFVSLTIHETDAQNLLAHLREQDANVRTRAMIAGYLV